MCVRLESGRVRCWGSNDSGELGYGHVQSLGDDEPIPSASVDVGAPVVDLSAGAAGTCVVTDAGGVRCWGDNETFGQLGYANFEQIGDDEVPAVAGDVPTLGGARDVEMHGLGWCARTLDERVACWYGGTLASGSQALDVALPNTPRDFGGSVYEACALVEPSLLGCWPCFNPPASPEVTLFSLGYETEAISSGGVSVHFCSWGNGSVHCWGDNSYGQLGTGDTRAWTPLDAPNAQIE